MNDSKPDFHTLWHTIFYHLTPTFCHSLTSQLGITALYWGKSLRPPWRLWWDGRHGELPFQFLYFPSSIHSILSSRLARWFFGGALLPSMFDGDAIIILRPSSIRNNIFSGKLHHPTSHLTCPNPAICRLYHGSQESGVQNELQDGWVLLGHLTSSNTCNLNETEFHRTYTVAETWCRMTPGCNGSTSKHNVWGLKHDVWWNPLSFLVKSH